ncbi:hypothetical protein ACI8AC_21085 [Geodermatophilus sp. SYSU D00758]
MARGGPEPAGTRPGRAGRAPGTGLEAAGFATGLAGLLLVVGFWSGVLLSAFTLGLLVSALGFVLSAVALVPRRRRRGRARWATAGLVCGAVGLLGPLLLVVYAVEQHVG